MLIEFGVLALLVRGSDKLMALILEPFSNAKLVLGGTEQTWLLTSVLVALSTGQSRSTAHASRQQLLTS